MAPTEIPCGFGFSGFLLQIVLVLRAQLGVNTKVVGLIPAWAIHLRTGLMTLMGSFQPIIFCDSVTWLKCQGGRNNTFARFPAEPETKEGEVWCLYLTLNIFCTVYISASKEICLA